MQDYSQPNFYHFNQDSIELVKFVIEKHREEKFVRILDLCAGSGVIGLELSEHYTHAHIDFVEYQREFEEHLNVNIDWKNAKGQTTVFIDKISSYSSNEVYDLIISNPPYFDPKSGRAAASELKQICRSFEVDSLVELENLKKRLKTKYFYFLSPKGLEYKVEKEISDNIVIYSL